MVVTQHSTTATYMYMYTSHQTPSHTTTATHITPDNLPHNHSYTHHTRHPPTQPQLPTSHQIQPTHNHSYPDHTKYHQHTGLNCSAYIISPHKHIPSGACPDLTKFSSMAMLRSTYTSHWMPKNRTTDEVYAPQAMQPPFPHREL